MHMYRKQIKRAHGRRRASPRLRGSSPPLAPPIEGGGVRTCDLGGEEQLFRCFKSPLPVMGEG